MAVTLRPSGIDGFFDCSYRWFMDTYYPIRRVSSAAHLGTGIHKAAETYYRDCISSKRWEPFRSDYIGAGLDTFRNLLKDDEPSDIKEIDELSMEHLISEKAKGYISKAEDLNSESIPLAVEQAYEIKLNSKAVSSIKGTLDIVGDGFIADIKTMNRLNNPSKYVTQQSVYALLRSYSDEAVDQLLIHRVLTKPGKSELDSIAIPGDIPSLVDRSKKLVMAIVKTCEEFERTGNEWLFRGNPSSMLCSPKYCPYYDKCIYKKGI